MSLLEYKCDSCNHIPQDKFVFKCVNKHIACSNCKNGYNCKCLAPLIKTKNPLCLLLERTSIDDPSTTNKLNAADKSKTGVELEPCHYLLHGCSWKFSKANLRNHLNECKYRPYKCVGVTLDLWKCSWIGPQHTFPDHHRICHQQQEESYKYFQCGSVEFVEKENVKMINLVDAFNKTFVFFYETSATMKMVYFLIYILARKEEATKFYYEFKIGAEEHRNVKFVESCFSDMEDIPKIIETEQCVALSHGVARKYSNRNQLNFRFILKHKNKDENLAINI